MAPFPDVRVEAINKMINQATIADILINGYSLAMTNYSNKTVTFNLPSHRSRATILVKN